MGYKLLIRGEPGSRAIAHLKFFAWLDLIGSFILSIIILVELSQKEIVKGTYYTYTEKVTDPIMIAIAISVLLQGIFACALFLVIAYIAENLIIIRKNTTFIRDNIPIIP